MHVVFSRFLTRCEPNLRFRRVFDRVPKSSRQELNRVTDGAEGKVAA